MSHKADSGLTVIIFCGCIYDGFHDTVKIIIAGQQRLTYCNLLKGICILSKLTGQLLILQTIHQMGGLYYQSLYAVVDGALQCFIHIVDMDAVPSLYMVNDNLCGKTTAYGIIGECFLHGVLNCADGQSAVVIKAGAKAGY